MQNKQFSTLPRFLNFLVHAGLLPRSEHLRLARGKVRLHRKLCTWQIQSVFVVLAHGERALLPNIRHCTNQRTGKVVTKASCPIAPSFRRRKHSTASHFPNQSATDLTKEPLMKKNPPSQSGFFNLRVLIAFSLCSVGVLLAMVSFAATPSSGTLTDTSGPLTYTSGPFFVANPTPIIFVDQGPECFGSAQPCDDYVLTVTLPAGYAAVHPNAAVKATLSWTDSGSGASDYDFYVFRGVVHDTDGSQQADFQSTSSSHPEIATISPVSDGTHQYTLKAVPYPPTGENVHVTVELLSGAEG